MTEHGHFRHDFWASYVDLYPDDGIVRGYAGYSPEYHVEDTRVRIKRYLTRKYVAMWITTERQQIESTSEIVKPYWFALAEKLGVVPEDLYNGGPGHLPRYAFTELAIDTSDRGNWPKAIDWLHKSLTIYLSVVEQSMTAAPHDPRDTKSTVLQRLFPSNLRRWPFAAL